MLGGGGGRWKLWRSGYDSRIIKHIILGNRQKIVTVLFGLNTPHTNFFGS